jgi:hypothetical protein
LAAEALGVVIGIVLSILLASWIAKKRLEKVTGPLLDLLKGLRKEGVLSPESTRRSVVCAVCLLGDSREPGKYKQIFGRTSTCEVCNLQVDTDTDLRQADSHRCKHCGLKDQYWRKGAA